ncbi:MAG: tRNA (adenosine(37)-N6)-threonylcarbamoyltransferase complex dimerization subunit type 1 TsaB, partial [Clostridia bacterium]|nr:tRNA (adenosine(37)-N6)-threonylcarbamoyltransferase complex dimerization subunit type 1 TsaB [Clostridia bacterium]
MKILALDSTAKIATVAMLDDEKPLAAYSIDNGLTQSELLLPMAEAMLKSLNIKFSEIELFAVTSGPGSFTGVRIGTALIKGMAFGKDIPCVSLSTLEALAENLRGLSGIATAVMDARRGQVYAAIFRLQDGEITRLTDDLAIPIADLYERLSEYKSEPIYLVGDGYELVHKELSERNLDTLCKTPKILR